MRTTLLYLGPAEAVTFRHWMDLFPPVPPFRRVPGTNLWHLSMDVPVAARIEYQLEVRRHGRARLLLDPLNPRRGGGPFGANSVLVGAGYHVPELAVPGGGVPRGRVYELPVASAVFGGTRVCRVYVPAGSPASAPALVIAHDGTEYLNYAAMGTVLDNLNAAGTPVAALLLDPGDRLVEYGADARHAAHVVDEALPEARRRMAVDEDHIIALGASFGAVAALHAAWAHPGTFAALALQSGSFVEALGGPHRRGPAFAPVVEFMENLQAEPGPLPARMHLCCGRYDGLIDDDRRTTDWLRRIGVEVGWEEADDGHHWGLWRDRLGEALRFLLPSRPSA